MKGAEGALEERVGSVEEKLTVHGVLNWKMRFWGHPLREHSLKNGANQRKTGLRGKFLMMLFVHLDQATLVHFQLL